MGTTKAKNLRSGDQIIDSKGGRDRVHGNSGPDAAGQVTVRTDSSSRGRKFDAEADVKTS